jgi:hypothetical protein
MDFTVSVYIKLIECLIERDYTFRTFHQSINCSDEKLLVLRHDVDKLPLNSLKFARMQKRYGINGTYYFRSVPESWDEHVIKSIAELGHEVGYHYENMDITNGDTQKAWDDFRHNLDKLRSLVDVKTICMHGSPRSKYDNREIWKDFDYHSLGIVGEPYFDINFDEMFYLTDTGRRWDGWKTSVRDKIPQQKQWNRDGIVFRSTNDIIDSVIKGSFPAKALITFHPQRWHEGVWPWVKELIAQNAKNQVKRVLVKRRG